MKLFIYSPGYDLYVIRAESLDAARRIVLGSDYPPSAASVARDEDWKEISPDGPAGVIMEEDFR